MKSISAVEANRRFSALLRDVAAERAAAKKRLLARLEQQAPTGERDWTRGELYES